MAVTSLQLVDNIAVTSSSALIYSQAVNMNGANAVQLTVVVTSTTSTTTLILGLEGSNDLSNWATISTGSLTPSWTTTASTVGFYAPGTATAIAFQYVRVTLKTGVTKCPVICWVNLCTSFL